MSLIVETGAGIPGANTYAALADADAYHAARNNVAWAAATTNAREAALIVATDYFEAFYRSPEPRLTASQGLQWPTGCTIGFPASVIAACCMLALEALNGPLVVSAERGIKRSAKTLEGVGEIEIEYDDAAPSDRFPHISAMLAEIAQPKGAGTIYVGRLTR